ncbi:LysR family transcriptional regulator [Rhizobium sp. TRM95796]|uniref:LysR family transcriptional regulator n=1 Tax=Rhizobium sp. TRM95796 TaxID=2979862 RepID=UPI0021E82708|nr:LysR family transcriptional regulator [Rhizobium sp. TRM95796]MCV3766283.1 LysR family transcriptional regulator [Rhizobium sp. TRM95796]
MKDIPWDAYQIFLTVARYGGLTGAAHATGLSAATLGRRVLQFEERLGRSLFHRSPTGYALTSDGQALFSELLVMEGAARRVEQWQSEAKGAVTIRIALGSWIGLFVSENVGSLVTRRDPIRLDLSIGEQRSQLSHREHHIGMRAHEPEEPNLAARLISEVAYAPFRRRNGVDYDRWIAVEEAEAHSAYLQWPHREKPGAISMTVNRPRSLLDLIRAGAGMAVLPCFIGDRDPQLERAGEEIISLRHRQWLVTHSDDRARREIRLVADRLAKLLKAHAELFSGGKNARSQI